MFSCPILRKGNGAGHRIQLPGQRFNQRYPYNEIPVKSLDVKAQGSVELPGWWTHWCATTVMCPDSTQRAWKFCVFPLPWSLPCTGPDLYPLQQKHNCKYRTFLSFVGHSRKSSKLKGVCGNPWICNQARKKNGGGLGTFKVQFPCKVRIVLMRLCLLMCAIWHWH